MFLVLAVFGTAGWMYTCKAVECWLRVLSFDQALQGVLSIMFLLTAIFMFAVVHFRNKKDRGE
jgi:hypothetical protein